ncbi:MAG: dihydrofolate reductase [Chlorobi bacterium]|nr:dihydrofolate reductase [Chlorobiota bacterium]
MMVSLIVAHDRNRVIGYQGKMPWHIPLDLKHFKRLTMGHCVVIGRKTFESIGKVLPGRHWIVLSSQKKENIDGKLTWVSTVEEALEVAKQQGEKELFIAGGAQIYNLFMPIADRLYITLIDSVHPGDTYFPEYDSSNWEKLKAEFVPPTSQNIVPISFIYLHRKEK